MTDRAGMDDATAAAVSYPSAGPRSGGLYGTVLVLAVITALTKGHDEPEPGLVLAGVLVTASVFWIVHVYADTLAARVTQPERRWRDIAAEHARHDITIVEAAIPPAVPLLLATLGVLGRDAAIWAAIGLGLLDLLAWGVLLGRALGYGPSRTIVIGLLNVALGGVMVGLKVLVH